MFYSATCFVSCVKLLLIPAYKSTDFEVHRNWLAITHNVPLKRWYFEDTSEWTLDYPPLFAYFEAFLSIFALLFDPNMLKVENLNYSSFRTVLFQRLSVILTDFVYIYGVYRISHCRNLNININKNWKTEVVLPLLCVANCGLLMLDHIHFQYNGIMYGILLISISYMMEGRYLQSAFWFTILLNMKHIYLYVAPAYFIYLLKHYCWQPKNIIKNTATLGAIVLGVFAVCFLPFYDHIPQVLSRLFPFKRGLCHAYWAPNFWALYNTVDKVLAVIFRKNNVKASMTGGLVQEFSHTVLPDIKPIITMALTGVFMLPAMVKLWYLKRNPLHFVRCIVICALTSFLFGWHVHEKAILMAIIPLSIMAIIETKDANVFLILSTVGHYSLFPLLYPRNLLIIKVVMLLIYTIYAFHSLSKIYPLSICKYSLPLTNIFETFYIFGLIPLFLYDNFLHNLLGLNNNLPYLPLMFTSIYCGIGVIYCWLKYYLFFLNKK